MARAFHWKDLTALTRYPKKRVFLDNVLSLTINPGLFSSSILSMISSTSGICTAVQAIESDHYPFLFGQAFLDPNTHSAHLAFLAPGDLDHPGYLELLAFLAGKAAERGALQLLAEVEIGSVAESILIRAGYRPYAEQQLWKAPRQAANPEQPNGWAPISEEVAAQVQEFSAGYVPGQVQRVEGFPPVQELKGMVYRQAGEMLGIARMRFGPSGILIDLVLDPELPDQVDLIKGLIYKLPYRNSTNYYFRVRAYQERIASALEQIGALPGPNQKAVVKRMAVHYNAKKAFLVRGFENQPDITTPISRSRIKN